VTHTAKEDQNFQFPTAKNRLYHVHTARAVQYVFDSDGRWASRLSIKTNAVNGRDSAQSLQSAVTSADAIR
jgi:hypothetical protein